jgi:processing peptidase subunit alpha
LIEELEKLGGMVQCVSNRESIIYVMDVMRHEVGRAFEILADTVLNPTFPDEELAEARHIVELQQTELPSEVFSRDLLQRAAYRGSPLGNDHYCPVEEATNVDAKRLQRFREKHFYAGNCILAVAGMDHDTALSLSKQAFAAFPVRKDAQGKVVVRPASATYGESKYTGGMLSQTRELKEPFVKIALGFEVGGWSDPLLVPLCVMQQILGGGSSFSAGGPGKGMFTRLYSQVLNRNFWAESVESFMTIHEHSGILGIDGACPEDKLVNMIQVIMQQFTTLATVPVPADELQRAKNMLKSSMMMQLESRLVQCEDIARQLATYGARDAPAVVCAKVDAVTAEDVMKVAQLMLAKPPSVGAVGHDLTHLPPYEKIAQFCVEYYGQHANKLGNTRFL